jgi:5'-nucleotidase
MSEPQRRGRLLAFATLIGLAAAPLSVLPAQAAPDGTGVVINEAYLSGGSRGAAFTNKFVELYNPTDAPIDISGWSLQYRKATGTEADSFGGVTPLTGSIAPKGYYLVSGNSNSTTAPTGAALPTPDVVGTIAPSGTTGTLALVKSTTPATAPAGDTSANPLFADVLGYGASQTFEKAVATAPASNTDVKSLNRTGFADSDDNAADFTLSATITPMNAAGETAAPTPTEPAPTPTPTVAPTGTPTPTPTETPAPGTPAELTAIKDIQGTTDASPLVGKRVAARGVVTAAYSDGGFSGYYIQTPATGGKLDLTKHLASEGLFVYSPSTVASVTIGDYVEVTGAVSEYFGLTQVTVAAASDLKQLDKAGVVAPTPAEVAYPATDAQREVLEGMIIKPQGAYTVTDNYAANQYAEIGLMVGTTPAINPTVLGKPGSAAYDAEVARTKAGLVKLDDASTINFLPRDDQPQIGESIPLPYLSTTNPVRVGAAVTFTKPVILDYRNSSWKFQPTSQLTDANAATVQPVTFANTREAAPRNVGGNVRLGTFNVLNYFSTTGDEVAGCTFYKDRADKPVTVNGGCNVRGAANDANLERQQAKIVAAINGLGADVISLEEIENSAAAAGKPRDEALGVLVTALNKAAGSDVWAFVPSPAKLPAKEDVIRTAFIYKKAVIETVGESTILTDSANFSNARQPNAQAFKPVGDPASSTFVVIANHFKSKSTSDAATGDNANTGQGAFTGDRTRQATDLVAFAEKMKTQAGTKKVFLVGDFNAYAAEDPIDVIKKAGYISQEAKTGEYTYAFGGAVGSLDHVFASPEADQTVTGADVWNINSVESVALEYSRFNYNAKNLYDASPFRSSDHDPVVVGINTGTSATTSINLLNINDFHGRIDENTVKFAGTVEGAKFGFGDSRSLFLSAGDNIGASLFASAVDKDQPTIDVLNALGLAASAVGNHEFDGGFADLTDRVIDGGKNAAWPYLGANVYKKGTTTPALDEYTVIDVDGVKVGVVGVVTEETATLVSPGGIADLTFGDPIEAVNRVAAQLSDGNATNGEADVIVAEYHEGAGAGTPEKATLEQEVAAGGAFADIVTKTSPEVDAIFTGHTHKQYVWDAAIPGKPGKTRAIVQTGNYGENIGQITLDVVKATGEVTAHTAKNIARVTTSDAALVAAYPRVAEVKTIVDAALAAAKEIGEQPIGSITADITRAFAGGKTDDRASESALGNFVADSLVSSLSSAERGGAEIGIVNPGGLRADLIYGTDGVITYAEANAVLPFVNNLWTTSLTGAQFKTVLEQQWQTNADGTVPSRPFLNLGLSKNVNYTYDASRAAGDRVTSISVNGAAIDPAKSYRIGSFSFLLQGGDNFREFGNGTNTRDSGLVDRDAWISYLSANKGASPSFDRRAVAVAGVPTAAVEPGSTVTFEVSKLDLTSLGAPVNTQLAVTVGDTAVATVPVTAGAATVTFTVPAGVSGAQTVTLTAAESKTVVRVPLQVTGATVPGEPTTPPVPAGVDALIDALKDLITTVKEFLAGKTIVINVGSDWIGKWVSVWLYSEPVLISDGWTQVDADGNVTVTIPAGTEPGAHRIAVQDASGAVIGWTDVTVLAPTPGTDPGVDPGQNPGTGAGNGTGAGTGSGTGTGGTGAGNGAGSLSNTGGELTQGLLAGLLLLLAGGGVFTAARLRRTRQNG